MFKANKPETCAGILGGAEGLSEGTEKAPGGRSQHQVVGAKCRHSGYQ